MDSGHEKERDTEMKCPVWQHLHIHVRAINNFSINQDLLIITNLNPCTPKLTNFVLKASSLPPSYHTSPSDTNKRVNLTPEKKKKKNTKFTHKPTLHSLEPPTKDPLLAFEGNPNAMSLHCALKNRDLAFHTPDLKLTLANTFTVKLTDPLVLSAFIANTST